MTIALVAFGADSNSAGASQFVGVPVPVGVQVGDLAIVSIALPAASMTVTPPDSSWVQLVQTDTTQSLGLIVFWTMVLNVKQVNWVFALSASVQAVGTALVYRGTDVFQPIDASVALLTAAGTSHNVAGISTQQPAEELVLFIAGAGNGTYTTPAAWSEATRKQQANASISAQHSQSAGQGAVAAFSETFSASALGASVVIALTPSPGAMTFADAYQRIFDALPPGIDNVLDFTPNAGDYWKLIWAIGAVFKLFVFDLVDLLRSEAFAHLSRYKLPDWEGLFGLRGTRTAQVGTIAQRRSQVLSAWRAAAGQGSSIPAVQGVLAPVLGYNATTPVRIIEAEPTALQAWHSYGFASDLVVAAGNTGSVLILVNDGGVVSKMGAQLEVAVDTPSVLSQLSFTLTGPDGTTFTWNGATSNWPTSPVKLYGPSFAKAAIQGNWTLAMTNNSAGSVKLFSSSSLFVEGIARGQDTGGAIYHWGVYADANHLGENGTPADLNASLSAVRRVSFSHTVGRLVQSIRPVPHQSSGLYAAIPGRCLPTSQGLFGSRMRSQFPIPTSTTGSTPEAGGRVYAFAMPLPSDVSGINGSVNVRIGNRAYNAGVGGSFVGNVALYACDSTGRPTGSAFGVFNGVTIPGDGTMTSIGPFTGVSPGVDGRVVALIGVPQGTAVAVSNTTQCGLFVAGTTTVSPAPGGLTSNPSAVFYIDLDYNSAQRHLIVLTDSIGVGYGGAAAGFETAAFYKLAQLKNWAIDIVGVVQFGSIQNFSLFGTNPFLWDELKPQGADFVYLLGTNDLSYNQLSTMQSAFNTLVGHATALGGNRHYGGTIPPQAAYPGTETVRTGWNSYLMANFVSLGLTAVRDRAARHNVGGLADDTDPTVLYGPYSIDGTHPNAAGQTQDENGWAAIL